MNDALRGSRRDDITGVSPHPPPHFTRGIDYASTLTPPPLIRKYFIRKAVFS